MERVLGDGVVVLSPLTMEDAEAHLAGDDPELARWLSGGKATKESVEGYIQRVEEGWVGGGPYGFGIRSEEELVGILEVHTGVAVLARGQANVAYGLYPSGRGRGLATRAVLLGCEFAREIGVEEAVIRVERGNGASQAVARRAGFSHVGARVEGERVMEWYVKDLREEGEWGGGRGP